MGHYSTYAIEGKSGKLLWKHEPGDFETSPAYEHTSPFVVRSWIDLIHTRDIMGCISLSLSLSL